MDLIPYLGSQRRRLIPALSLDTPSPVRKPVNSAGVRWVDGPLRSTQRGLGEPFEIKVYEIDDVERLQRRRGGDSKVSYLLCTWWQGPSRSLRRVLGQGPESGARPHGESQWASVPAKGPSDVALETSVFFHLKCPNSSKAGGLGTCVIILAPAWNSSYLLNLRNTCDSPTGACIAS